MYGQTFETHFIRSTWRRSRPNETKTKFWDTCINTVMHHTLTSTYKMSLKS